jgi:putative membrane protein insertion efficiency factor
MGKVINCVREIVSFPIRLYRCFLSPIIPSCCRFYPSCSQYALQAIQHYGIGKGLWLTCRRLLKCHPWANGGYDPILPMKEKP